MTFESRHMRGFTLIELMVTVAIFVFMTALIISRYGSFNQGTLMTNLAYDTALSVRTAQTYGVSVKGIEDTGVAGFNQGFNYAYGIDFDVSKPTSFFIFIDGSNSQPANSQFDAGETVVSTYNLKQGAKISSLCSSTDGTGLLATCLSQSAKMDIVFKRPDPSAVINVNGATVSGGVPYNYAAIVLTSADNTANRKVVVLGNGQISVNK